MITQGNNASAFISGTYKATNCIMFGYLSRNEMVTIFELLKLAETTKCTEVRNKINDRMSYDDIRTFFIKNKIDAC